MSNNNQLVLERLVDRLYASMVQGPCLNCRPHLSRQRFDLTAIKAFKHLDPTQIIPQLLSTGKSVEILAKAVQNNGINGKNQAIDDQTTKKSEFDDQTKLLLRVKDVAVSAYDYEQETGENALYIGYPLISIPPISKGLDKPTTRILAPVALIAVDLLVKSGNTQSVKISTKGSGTDLVVANFPLLSWLEQQTGVDTSELFTDEEGTQPYKEINEIVKILAEALKVTIPSEFSPESGLVSVPKTEQLPSEITLLNCAVAGLFPVSNQSLLRDMKAMMQDPQLSGPVTQFLSIPLQADHKEAVYSPPSKQLRRIAEERLICEADPCQTRATLLSKEAPTLVIHGPPGTGKSQTITNIIGDHLSRGERVLMVCDKRTALDVVHNRLESLGLDHLCAIVHDAQRDQRSLYMSIRDYMDTLVERRTNPNSETDLKAVNEELQKLHLELSGYYKALSEAPSAGEASFHNLVGEWLSYDTPANLALEDSLIQKATFSDYESCKESITEVLDRAFQASFPKNPWANAAGLEMSDFLSQPTAKLKKKVEALQSKTDDIDLNWSEGTPPLNDSDLTQQAELRERTADILLELDSLSLRSFQKAWFSKPSSEVINMLGQFSKLDATIQSIAKESLNPEWPVSNKTVAEINPLIVTLQEYLEITGSWHGFLHIKKKTAAGSITSEYGLAVSPESAQKIVSFLTGLKARITCQAFIENSLGHPPTTPMLNDSDLLSYLTKYCRILNAIAALLTAGTEIIRPAISEAIETSFSSLASKLKVSAKRARAMDVYFTALHQTELFSSSWIPEFRSELNAGKPAGPTTREFLTQFDTMECILRLRLAYTNITESLRSATASLIFQSANAAAGMPVLKQSLLKKEIANRIRTNPFLQQVDKQRMEICFQKYHELEAKKRILVRDVIDHLWVTRQKQQLLSSTGTQLNSTGTALKRRLLTRGEKSMKLRQMILHGASGNEADPLFDVCPVWMASPATVAQIFPRKELFSLIVFDEASQCRQEEAMPALLRGKRIVIAGDLKQLPPTRFFESAIVESEVDDVTSEQELFERQQADTEDLLGAALNISTHQSYLDVHYRSNNESLIGFSNSNFYQNRLQPIPCFPRNQKQEASIKIVTANGIYEDRCNKKEAQCICGIVEKLLATEPPPSIGIACFNLTQRSVIIDAIDKRCEENPEFAQKVEIARKRQGKASFEGLFVKNLENVQGDERDHIIISTTFGPDSSGKFRRNFGPLSQVGGGRRLNVLVTRAREMIHMVTSIPQAEYRRIPDLEDGQTPNGRWLLYRYLTYTEQIEQKFKEEQNRISTEKSSGRATAIVDKTDQASKVASCLASKITRGPRP